MSPGVGAQPTTGRVDALHIYPHGRHGLGLGTREGYDPAKLLPWTRELELWLGEQGFIR